MTARVPMPLGSRWGQLTIIGLPQRLGTSGLYYPCRCDCGTEKTVNGNNLRQGRSRSCGCQEGARTHGLAEWRAVGLQIDRVLVELCGTIVLVGPRVSEGMGFESSWAKRRIDLTGLSDDAPTEWYLCSLVGDALAVDVLRELDARMLAGGIGRVHG